MKSVWIILILICIYFIGAEIIYINFEMEAWARGMEKTSTAEKVAVSVVLIIPIILLGKVAFRVIKKKK